MLEKFILMQHRNCKIMWLIMTDKDNISVSEITGRTMKNIFRAYAQKLPNNIK